MIQPINPVQQVDRAFYFIFGASIIILLGITVAALVMVYRYHHTRHPVSARISGNMLLEAVWIILPSILVLFMFHYGWVGYKALRTVPENAMEVSVVGRMFSWSFAYEDGKRSNVLYVPVNTPVRLNITSDDVIHSLYIPAFRIKMDAVPGMDSYAWFDADTLGSYDILCAEYCGVQHANMLSTVEVVSQEDFDKWLASESSEQEEAVALFNNYGCTGCHSLDGSRNVGPSLKNLFGKKQIVVDAENKEHEIVVDKQYLREAIYEPEKYVVKGYPAVMPSYKGQVSGKEVERMIGWITGEIAQKPVGRDIVENNGCLSCHSTDGSILVAPSFKGIWNKRITLEQNGIRNRTRLNRAVLEEILHDPSIVREGKWDVMMPDYKSLSAEEIDAIGAYLKSLAGDENASSPSTTAIEQEK